jgi:hypothetical protein
MKPFLLALLLIPAVAAADEAEDFRKMAVEMSKCYGIQRAFSDYVGVVMPDTPGAEKSSGIANGTRIASVTLFSMAGFSNDDAERAVDGFSQQPNLDLSLALQASHDNPEAMEKALQPLAECENLMVIQESLVKSWREQQTQ